MLPFPSLDTDAAVTHASGILFSGILNLQPANSGPNSFRQQVFPVFIVASLVSCVWRKFMDFLFNCMVILLFFSLLVKYFLKMYLF